MTTATDIAWLSGIIDGEGCITGRQNSIRSLGFRITIESVSVAMMNRIQDILRQCCIQYRIEGPMMRERSTRPSYRIRIDTKHAVWKLCNLILPYSVVKKPELILIKSYLDRAVGTYYSAMEEDMKILLKLRELKKVA